MTHTHYSNLLAFILALGLFTGDQTPVRAQAPTARVSVVKPRRETVRRITAQPGQVQAFETTPIYAKLSGYVQIINVNIGDKVKQGQVLAELRVPEVVADRNLKLAEVRQAEAERAQFEAAVLVAKAGITASQAKVQEESAGIKRAEADVNRWKSELARVEQLHREHALTGSLLDETRSKFLASEAGRDEVKAQAATAEAGLAQAQAALVKSQTDAATAAAHVEVARIAAERAAAMADYARIIAPFDGIVTKRGIDPGHLTTAGTTGEPLFVVSRNDVVTVTVGVPELHAPYVNTGDRAVVTIQALRGGLFEAKVTRTSWSLDNATRTLRAEIDLPNPGNVIRPGLYGYVEIIAEESLNALTVPPTALVAGDSGKVFCVAVVDGHAKRKEVKVGISDRERVEIVSGVDPEDMLVEANADSLVDGQAVEKLEVVKPKS